MVMKQSKVVHNLKKVEEIKQNKSMKLFPCLFTLNNSSVQNFKRSKPKLIYLLLFSLLSSCFVFAPHLLFFPNPSALFLLDSSIIEIENRVGSSSPTPSKTDSSVKEIENRVVPPLKSSKTDSSNKEVEIRIGSPKLSKYDSSIKETKSRAGPHLTPSRTEESSIWCDRSGYRSDICFIKGDIRTHSSSSSIFLSTSENVTNHISIEKIKPYTRKWETSIMNTIPDLKLITKNVNHKHTCDVIHDVPAVLFSTGGYTGNLYHEFNDGIIPLYITSQRFNKKVVFVILEYHKWWEMKYEDVLSQLSDYPLVDFSKDKRIHCFKEAIVGLRIHGELTVEPSQMQDGSKTTIKEFRDLLDRAYRPRITRLETEEGKEVFYGKQRPKLVLFSRIGSRGIRNEKLMVKLAQRIGFRVQILRPDRTTELAKIYKVLNSSNVMLGVHGAAMTHFLFIKPGNIFIQIVPLGTDWAAETYYGEPAKKLGLDYIDYKILPRESSLSEKYHKDDPVLRDPNSITQKGWEFTKGIYLDKQQVRLDLTRFKKVLVNAYAKSIR